MENRSIAIDGPSGAGKSTLARMVAEKYNMIYVDTGAMYRCIGLYVFRRGISSKDAEAVESVLGDINIELVYSDGLQRMLLCGEDVTSDIRLPEISIYASDVSAMPPVRAFLLDMQRSMAKKYNVIMDGRDIGTVVLKNAGLKVFLTAQPEVRAMRRYKELLEKGVETTFDDVLRDINYRDKNDSSRKTAPLRPAEDSVLLDTTDMDLETSFAEMCKLVEVRFGS